MEVVTLVDLELLKVKGLSVRREADRVGEDVVDQRLVVAPVDPDAADAATAILPEIVFSTPLASLILSFRA